MTRQLFILNYLITSENASNIRHSMSLTARLQKRTLTAAIFRLLVCGS